MVPRVALTSEVAYGKAWGVMETDLASDCFTHVALGFVASAFLWVVGLGFAVVRKAIMSAGSVD